jgi:hypothetical protein
MGNHETEAFAMALHGGLFNSLVAKTAFDEQHALREMADVLHREMESMFDSLKAVPDADDNEKHGEDCDSSSIAAKADPSAGALERFARAAHDFCVRNGHTCGGNAVNIGTACGTSRSPNLQLERHDLLSAFSKSKQQGLVRRALACCPGAFTFLEDQNVFAQPAFSFHHSASTSDGENQVDIDSRCVQVQPAPHPPRAFR